MNQGKPSESALYGALERCQRFGEARYCFSKAREGNQGGTGLHIPGTGGNRLQGLGARGEPPR